MVEVQNLLRDIQLDSKVNSVVLISGKINSFIAGADISMLQNAKTEDEAYQIAKNGQIILNSIAESKKPIVAAIQGTCLGGGLEVIIQIIKIIIFIN